MKNLRFAIYPNAEQAQKLAFWIAICRLQYNSALIDRQEHYRQHRKGLSHHDLQKRLTADKARYSILRTVVPSQPLQETLFRLDKAYQNFFASRARYPRLKTARDYRSLTFPQFGIGK